MVLFVSTEAQFRNGLLVLDKISLFSTCHITGQVLFYDNYCVFNNYSTNNNNNNNLFALMIITYITHILTISLSNSTGFLGIAELIKLENHLDKIKNFGSLREEARFQKIREKRKKTTKSQVNKCLL